MRTTNVLILTDDGEFARLLAACWQVERHLPGISVLTSDLWNAKDPVTPDLMVIGPLNDGKLAEVLRSISPSTAVILCGSSDGREFGALR